MLPRPRNFTGGLYKIRTTASGQLPTDADLERANRRRASRKRDAGWKGRLSDGERRDAMAYIKTFSSFFADTSQHVVPLKFSSPPSGGTSDKALKWDSSSTTRSGAASATATREGDGPSAPTLKDDADFPIFAADLHQN